MTNITEGPREQNNNGFVSRICDTLKYVHRYCELVGVLPITRTTNEDKTDLKLTAKNVMYSVTYAVIYFFITSLTVLLFYYDDSLKLAKTEKSTPIVFFLLMGTIIIFCVTLSYTKRSVLYQIYQDLSLQDQVMLTVNVPIRYNALAKQTNRFFFFIMGISFFKHMLLLCSTEIPFYIKIYSITIASVKLAKFLEVSTLWLQVVFRFQLINDALASYKSLLIGNPLIFQSVLRNMGVLCNCQQKLRQILKNMESALRIQTLIIVVVLELSIFGEIILMYNLAFKQYFHDKYIKIGFCGVWFLEELIAGIYTISCAEDLYEQIDLIGVTIHEINKFVQNVDAKKKIHRYSLHATHNKVIFTGSGMFTIDYSLIYTIIGAGITFIMLVAERDLSSRISAEQTTATSA